MPPLQAQGRNDATAPIIGNTVKVRGSGHLGAEEGTDLG